MKRRNFIQQTVLSAIASSCGIMKLPFIAGRETYNKISFGICADLHQDLIFDAPRRLSAFMDDMMKRKPNFIIQMGDFCWPKKVNKPIIEIWNRFDGPKHNVIGNHDLEGQKFTREQLLNFWGGVAPYYSFDVKGYHFVILDGNERNPEHVTHGNMNGISVTNN